MDPQVSFLIPVRNAELYLDSALKSLERQTFRDFEVVLVLDGSSDRSAEIARLSGLAPKIIEIPPSGIAKALNLGLAECSGHLIARMDADDVCAPSRLALQVAEFNARPDLGLLGGDANLIDSNGDSVGMRKYPTGDWQVRRQMIFRNVIAHPAAMLRRQAIDEVGGYNPNAEWFEDYELWLRLALKWQVDNLSVPLIGYRTHDAQSYKRFSPSAEQLEMLLQRRLDLSARCGLPRLVGHAAQQIMITRGKAKRLVSRFSEYGD